MKKKLLNVIYIGAWLPLLVGTITFLYWFIKRMWFAQDAEIAWFAYYTILFYFVAGVITLILSVIYVVKQKEKWKKIISPVSVVFITFLVVYLYGSVYSASMQQAFVKVVNDSEGTVVLRVYSDNFEHYYFDRKAGEFIFSYYPVYNFDWTPPASGHDHDYTVNPVSIEVKMENDSVRSFDFPRFLKGECGTVLLSEILETK
uniref:hypothetical protein n=1 Tax=uncultured Draconibacterium sp. TaxID=1573823 RepID=UPI0032179299